MKSVEARGKTFEFDDDATNQEIGEALDWYFSRSAPQANNDEDIPYIDDQGDVQFRGTYTPGSGTELPPIERSAGTTPGGLAMSAVAGINRGVLSVADLPSNIVNLAASALGKDKAALTVSDVLNHVGEASGMGPLATMASTPQEYAQDTAPERFLGRVSEEAGAGMGAHTALQAAARNAPKGSALHALGLDSGLMAREMNASLGAGTGAAIANEVAPDSVAAEVVGAVAGGITSQVPNVVRAPFRAAREQIVEPFTEEGARRRVSTVLSEQASDPEMAVENIKRNRLLAEAVAGDADIPTTQLAQDEGLSRAINALSGDDAKILGVIARGGNEYQEALLRNLDGQLDTAANPADAVRVVADTIDGLTARLDDQITLAKDKMDQMVQGGMNIEDLGQNFTDALEAGWRNARAIERKIWKRVDKRERIDVVPLRHKVKSLYAYHKRRPIAESSIPEEQFLSAGKLGNDPSRNMQELIDYRSNITQARRQALAAGDNQKAAILSEIEREVNSFIDTAGTSPAYRAAAEYTRTMHQNFTRGPFGRLLKIDATGAERIDPEAALQAIVRPQGAGAARGDDVVSAERGVPGKFPAVPGLSDPVENYLTTKFKDAATPKSRETFLRNYGPILRKFPELNRNLGEMDNALEALAERQAQLEGRRATVMDRSRVGAAALLGADPDKLYSTLSTLSAQEAKSLMKLLSREGVESGAQQAVLRQIYNNYTKQGLVDRGRLLDDLLKNDSLKVLYDNVLSDAQKANLRKLDQAAGLLNPVKTPGGTPNVKNVVTNSVLVSLMARAASSRIGTFFASGENALIVASAAARAGQDIVNRLPSAQARALIEQALVDPDLMADLLQPTIAKNPQAVEGIIRGHLYTLGFRATDNNQETQPQ